MYTAEKITTESKIDFYSLLNKQAKALLDGETDLVANAANISSLLYHSLSEINWSGFYFSKKGELVLGPFMGKPACNRIPFGKGVCGTAAATQRTQVVQNVHEFPGHIACDSDSNSEIVVPIVIKGKIIGVLDIDSPLLSRFDSDDQSGLEELIRIFISATNCDE